MRSYKQHIVNSWSDMHPVKQPLQPTNIFVNAAFLPAMVLYLVINFFLMWFIFLNSIKLKREKYCYDLIKFRVLQYTLNARAVAHTYKLEQIFKNSLWDIWARSPWFNTHYAFSRFYYICVRTCFSRLFEIRRQNKYFFLANNLPLFWKPEVT